MIFAAVVFAIPTRAQFQFTRPAAAGLAITDSVVVKPVVPIAPVVRSVMLILGDGAGLEPFAAVIADSVQSNIERTQAFGVVRRSDADTVLLATISGRVSVINVTVNDFDHELGKAFDLADHTSGMLVVALAGATGYAPLYAYGVGSQNFGRFMTLADVVGRIMNLTDFVEKKE